ncbi:hypothetical protein [Nocardioides aurantiacus]|uniref:hypothetical protein n=1 Tax=Nocardioides aurantiacus TaxID=86796 RepID=UPI00403F9311
MTIALNRPHRHDLAVTTTSATTPEQRRREGATRDLAVRHLQGVSTLLAQRDDLRGVHAFADVVEESVRWSA